MNCKRWIDISTCHKVIVHMFELFTVSNITHNLRSEIDFSVDIARNLYIWKKYFSFSCIEDLMTVPQIIKQLMNLRQKQKSETNKMSLSYLDEISLACLFHYMKKH